MPGSGEKHSPGGVEGRAMMPCYLAGVICRMIGLYM